MRLNLRFNAEAKRSIIFDNESTFEITANNSKKLNLSTLRDSNSPSFERSTLAAIAGGR